MTLKSHRFYYYSFIDLHSGKDALNDILVRDTKKRMKSQSKIGFFFYDASIRVMYIFLTIVLRSIHPTNAIFQLSF